MARRANTSPKQRPAKPAQMPELPATGTSRRGRKSKATEQAAITVDDELFSGEGDTVAIEAEPASSAPIKARRGRKPKPKAEPDADMASPSQPEAIEASEEPGRPEAQADSGDAPSAEPSGAADPADAASAKHPPAVRWNGDTGTATFDWPGIEKVASIGGPNQTMAKLLLAARAEGANSRWPF